MKTVIKLMTIIMVIVCLGSAFIGVASRIQEAELFKKEQEETETSVSENDFASSENEKELNEEEIEQSPFAEEDLEEDIEPDKSSENNSTSETETNRALPATSYKVATLDEIPRDGWFWPAPSTQIISSPFNLDSKYLQSQRNVKNPASKVHGGIDISGSFKVYCARDGVIENIVRIGENGGTCCEVTIRHEANGLTFWSRYLHFASNTIPTDLKKGQKVYAGKTFLGISGNTGNSEGNHLHFEVSIVSTGSKSVKESLNVNPKESLGVKYSDKYSKPENIAEIRKYVTLNYSFDAKMVHELNEFQKGCNRSFLKGIYIITKKTTTRSYPLSDAPKGIKLEKGQYVVALAEGYNSYHNRFILVRELNSNRSYYIHESYLGKVVTSSSIVTPTIKSIKNVATKGIAIEMKSTPEKGMCYVAVFTCGTKKIEKEFSGLKYTYKVDNYGTWSVSVYAKIKDSSFTVKGSSSQLKPIVVIK